MILIVSATFDKSGHNVIKSLQKTAIDYLIAHDQAVELHEVPGAVEIPVAIQHFVLQDPEKYSAVIALGCVIKGDTDHYELVTRSVTDGLTQLALDLDLPVIQGVLACLNADQAVARKSMGKEYAETALAMKGLFETQK